MIAAQGCGPAALQKSNRIPTHSLSEAQRLAKQGQVTCASSQNCPQAVALLTVTDPQQVSLCTSFLIAPDLLATNSHCIPADLRPSGTSCVDRIWARFPDAPGRAGEQVACKAILFASGKTKTSDPDYAFIRLDHSLTRAPLTISHEGLADGAPYRVSKINPQSLTVPVGVLEQVSCVTPQRTLITPEFDSELAAVGTIADCDIVHGNSGSPLIDENGKLRGIIQGTMEPAALKKDLADQSFQLFDGEIAPLGVASNFACVRLASEAAATGLPQGCGAPVRKASPEFDEILEKEGLKLITAWNAAHPPATAHLDWAEGALDFDAHTLSVTPRCFKAGLAWLDPLSETRALAFELPYWEYSAGVNRYLQASYRLAPAAKTYHASFRFSPSALRTRGQSAVQLQASQLLQPSRPLFDGAIPACP